MVTGRVIRGRYLLQRVIQQGAACTVYQGFDQVLQRAVAVKVAPVEHIPAYRTALRATAQFAHPNIIGVYDLIVEPDTLCIVQEYVEGSDFVGLLRSPLAAYEVADIGAQICQALIYAGTPSRKVCHGDLTPAAILRDSRGLVRVNNFALPSDLAYFSAWNTVGGAATSVLSDMELPAGQMSEGRRADDTRAVGLLLYQLLAGRSPDANVVEPPTDGRLRFMRNVPAEVCEVIARAVVRRHPQRIVTAEALHSELKALAEALEPLPPAVPEPAYVPDEFARFQQFSPAPGRLFPAASAVAASAVPAAATYDNTTEEGVMPRGVTSSRMAAAMDLPAPAASISTKLAAAQQAAYASGRLPDMQQDEPRRINGFLILVLGLLLFGLFFALGYVLAHVVFP